GGAKHMAVTCGDFGNQEGDIFRQLIGVGGVVGNQNLAHARHLGRGFTHGTTVGTGDQNIDIATDSLGRGNHIEGSGVEAAVVVLCNYENAHQITFASFLSLSTSSATSATLIP